MCHRKQCRGFTLLETLIVIGILACLVIMLLPAIQSAREASRKAACLGNMQRLGRAMEGYMNAHEVVPPSSGVTKGTDGKITAVDGWSWIVTVWRNMEHDKKQGDASPVRRLFERLDVASGHPLFRTGWRKGDAACGHVGHEFSRIVVPELPR